MANNVQDFGHTAPPTGGMEDYGHTEPPTGSPDSFGQTVPPTGGTFSSADFGNPFADPGPTQAPNHNGGFETGFAGVSNFGSTEPIGSFSGDPFQTSPAGMNGMPSFQPVVGWLVCVDGPERGKDYRIHSEYNYIGRADNLDINLQGDMKISREDSAVIAYDPVDRMFYVGNRGGRNIVRYNGKPLLESKELHVNDVLTIGGTKLMFIPLCGPNFGWDE